IEIALAASVTRRTSSSLISFSPPATATTPCELTLAIWAPPTETKALEIETPAILSADSTLSLMALTASSISMTCPLRKPRETAVEPPITVRASSRAEEAIRVVILELPTSIPTIIFSLATLTPQAFTLTRKGRPELTQVNTQQLDFQSGSPLFLLAYLLF